MRANLKKTTTATFYLLVRIGSLHGGGSSLLNFTKLGATGEPGRRGRATWPRIISDVYVTFH